MNSNDGLYLAKYGAPYVLSEKGRHQYRTMIKQYMQGLKMNDDKLLILFGLGIYGTNVGIDVDVDTEMQISEEIKEKINLDMTEYDYHQYVKAMLFRLKLIIDNPDYNEEFSKEVLKRLEIV